MAAGAVLTLADTGFDAPTALLSSLGLQLARVADKHWRRLNGYELLARVIAGVQFVDGVELIPKAKAA